jgi:hypothetical protein
VRSVVALSVAWQVNVRCRIVVPTRPLFATRCRREYLSVPAIQRMGVPESKLPKVVQVCGRLTYYLCSVSNHMKETAGANSSALAPVAGTR